MSFFTHRATAFVVLFSQFLLLTMGTPLLVVCEAAGGHEKVEFAHSSPCEDSGSMPSDCGSTDGHESVHASTGHCVDTPLTQLMGLHQNDRPVFQPAPAVLLFVSAFEAADAPRRTPQAPLHLSTPDSPESLARSVILLI